MRGAIFDVDGTLLDSMPMWDNAGERYLARLGKEAEPGLGRKLFPLSMEQAALYMKERYCLSCDVAEIVAGVEDTIRRFYREEVRPKPGVKEFLIQMRDAGFVITAATSGSRNEVEAAFSRCGLDSFFSQIFTCSEIGAGKDRPDIYEAARAFMGTEKGNAWVFEDALYAAKTAWRAGFPVVGVYDEASRDDREELYRISKYYLDDFHDFNAFYRIASGGGV